MFFVSRIVHSEARRAEPNVIGMAALISPAMACGGLVLFLPAQLGHHPPVDLIGAQGSEIAYFCLTDPPPGSCIQWQAPTTISSFGKVCARVVLKAVNWACSATAFSGIACSIRLLLQLLCVSAWPVLGCSHSQVICLSLDLISSCCMMTDELDIHANPLQVHMYW